MLSNDVGSFGTLSYRVDQLEKYAKKLEKQIDDHEKLMHDMEKASLEREKSRLRWGIGALGTVLSTLVGLLWTYRKIFLQGGP